VFERGSVEVPLDQKGREVAMRLGEIGLQRNGSAILVRRFVEPPERPQSVTEAVMSIRRSARAG
jgi:hypothetical protein